MSAELVIDDRPVLEPVRLEIVRACHYKAKPCGLCGLPMSNKVHKEPHGTPECPGQKKLGCANCGLFKGDEAHLGAPESFNVIASGKGSGNFNVYNGQKKIWQEAITKRLVESRLPRGLGHILYEFEITFPDRARRDAGNFRVIPEKALGDALVHGYGDIPGGWLEDDDWNHFDPGGMTQLYQPGESAMRITLFPAWAPDDPSTQGALPI